MWVFTKYGAASVVTVPLDLADRQYTNGTRDMQMRGRSPDHLADIVAKYGEGLDVSEVQERGGADYRYRVYLSRADMVELMRRVVEDIDYGNFKSAARGAYGYSGLLHGVWRVFHEWANPNSFARSQW